MKAAQTQITTRPLTKSDFETVVEIDAKITGRNRPGFFQKRLHAALAEPKHFIYIACEFNGELKGFLMARLLGGEYGLNKPFVAIDVIDVDPEVQGKGLGRALMHAYDDILKRKNLDETRTQADWRNQDILRFFASAGFRLAPRHILEREVSYLPTNVSQASGSIVTEESEIDYSDAKGDQVGALARDTVICRSLQSNDLDSLIAIDRKISGFDHSSYYQRKVKEALDETGIRVSLVAEIKGVIVGFIMARVDYGEFDRTEPIAALDTLAVDPGYTHHHVATSLLAQLLGNLASLRLDNIRTEVGADQFELTSFLMNNQFYPAQHLSFYNDSTTQGMTA